MARTCRDDGDWSPRGFWELAGEDVGTPRHGWYFLQRTMPDTRYRLQKLADSKLAVQILFSTTERDSRGDQWTVGFVQFYSVRSQRVLAGTKYAWWCTGVRLFPLIPGGRHKDAEYSLSKICKGEIWNSTKQPIDRAIPAESFDEFGEPEVASSRDDFSDFDDILPEKKPVVKKSVPQASPAEIKLLEDTRAVETFVVNMVAEDRKHLLQMLRKIKTDGVSVKQFFANQGERSVRLYLENLVISSANGGRRLLKK